MSGREKLAGAFLAAYPDTAARLLEARPIDEVAELIGATDPQSAARLFGRMLPGYTARCLERIPREHIAQVIEKMDSHDAIAVLRQLTPTARLELLRALRPQWSAAFELLLRYPANTVGAWTEPFVLTLPADCTVAEARERVERNEQTVKARIYVLDRSRQIRGAVRGLTLLRNAGDVRLSTLLEPVIALWARETLAAALTDELWERDAEAPVVTRDREFIGAVAYADLHRAQRRQSHPDTHDERRHELSEFAELLASGAGSIWESVGALVHPHAR